MTSAKSGSRRVPNKLSSGAAPKRATVPKPKNQKIARAKEGTDAWDRLSTEEAMQEEVLAISKRWDRAIQKQTVSELALKYQQSVDYWKVYSDPRLGKQQADLLAQRHDLLNSMLKHHKRVGEHISQTVIDRVLEHNKNSDGSLAKRITWGHICELARLEDRVEQINRTLETCIKEGWKVATMATAIDECLGTVVRADGKVRQQSVQPRRILKSFTKALDKPQNVSVDVLGDEFEQIALHEESPGKQQETLERINEALEKYQEFTGTMGVRVERLEELRDQLQEALSAESAEDAEVEEEEELADGETILSDPSDDIDENTRAQLTELMGDDFDEEEEEDFDEEDFDEEDFVDDEDEVGA